MKTKPRPAPRTPAGSSSPVRLNRFLGMCGVSSRRGAEVLITEGRVKVNGAVVTALATTVRPRLDRVFVNGNEVIPVDVPVYLVLNKPKDTITTAHDEKGRTTVMDVLRSKRRVFPIGRLDRNTTGVLLFTNDGEFAHHLMHPRFEVPKAYTVTCDKPITREHMQQLRHGVRLPKGVTSPANVVSIPGSRGKEVGITIHEGWNRQVRLMFETLGYDVRKLDRVAYGPVTKEGLPRGATRPLTPQEIRGLKSLAGIEED